MKAGQKWWPPLHYALYPKTSLNNYLHEQWKLSEDDEIYDPSTDPYLVALMAMMLQIVSASTWGEMPTIPVAFHDMTVIMAEVRLLWMTELFIDVSGISTAYGQELKKAVLWGLVSHSEETSRKQEKQICNSGTHS